MAQFAPQYNLFEIIRQLRRAGTSLFWLILFFSIVPDVFKRLGFECPFLSIINIANIISIFLFFGLDLVVNYVLTPQAENKRRDDFIDNSFGSKFSIDSSISYYDNNEVANGLYKAAVNLFEDCFFTANLMRAALVGKIIIPAIGFLSLVVLAYFGFREVPVALTVLQFLFSATILGSLVKDVILSNQLNTIEDAWIAIFQHDNVKTDITKYHAQIYKYWLQYETLISWTQPNISGKLYKKMNPGLTDDWAKLKAKYNIN
jgi:hypothetical protein